MARGSRGNNRRIASRRSCSYSFSSSIHRVSESLFAKKHTNPVDKRDYEDVICSVCMECPHNAVLLLCSSHDKGCRPYMCETSFRYSNCLDQYKKAYTKVIPSNHALQFQESVEAPNSGTDMSLSLEKFDVMKLTCPLCRGQVKGWTVVKPAREYLNLKKRNCMQDDCSFIGTYRELRKHMKAKHPCAQPREVDPALERKWRSLEHERDRGDVISTIRSTMSGAMVFGDYVIEGDNYQYDTDDGLVEDVDDGAERSEGFRAGLGSNLVNVFLLLHAFGPSGSGIGGRTRQSGRTRNAGSNIIAISSESSDREDSDGNSSDGVSAFRGIRHDGGGHWRRRRAGER